MENIISSTAEIFSFNTGFFLSNLDGFGEKEARTQINNGVNPVLWIAGHNVYSRYIVNRLAGVNAEYPSEELFKMGAIYNPDAKYPSIETIKEEWSKISESMMETLDNMDETSLLKDCPHKFPVKENTTISGICFMLMHESYHIGQIGYIRKALGLKTFA